MHKLNTETIELFLVFFIICCQMIVGILMCVAFGYPHAVSAYSSLQQVHHRDMSFAKIILHHCCIAMLKHGVGVMIAVEIYLLNAQGDFTV